MGLPNVGEPTANSYVILTYQLRLETNVRETYLRHLVGTTISDYLNAFLKSWNESAAKDDPNRYVHVKAIVGPALVYTDHEWNVQLFPGIEGHEEQEYYAKLERERPAPPLESEYEQEDDPYYGESASRYEEDHELKPQRGLAP